MLPNLQTFLREHRSVGQLGVYNGQQRVGTIVEVGGEALAFDAFGDALGWFRKRSDAMRSIPSQVDPKPSGAPHG
jgi:hypothetical protein